MRQGQGEEQPQNHGHNHAQKLGDILHDADNAALARRGRVIEHGCRGADFAPIRKALQHACQNDEKGRNQTDRAG